MGMPEIPEGKHRPSLEETIVDLLESIALEEMALAHLMNAEGERMQATVKGYQQEDVSYQQVQQSCEGTRTLMNSLIMKEWLLFNKLTTVLAMDIPSSSPPPEAPPALEPPFPCQPCNSSLQPEEDGLIRVPTTIKKPCKPRTP